MKEIIITPQNKNGIKEYIGNRDFEIIDEMVDEIIKERNDSTINYGFIRDMVLYYINNSQFCDVQRSKTILLKKWEIIHSALEFYRSIDEGLYVHVNEIIFNRKKKLKIHLYDLSEIKDLDEKDEEFTKMDKYVTSACNSFLQNKCIIHIPLKTNKNHILTSKEDEGIIDDLYTLTHELAHTFDNDLNDVIDSDDLHYANNRFDGCNIFDESTAIAFEKYLHLYLLKKGTIKDDSDVADYLSMRNNDTLKKCIFLYLQIILTEKKEKVGRIFPKDIDEIFDILNISQSKRRKLFETLMIDLRAFGGIKDFFINMRYGISGMISPTMVELIQQGKIENEKRIFEASRKRDYSKVFEILGITQDDRGIEDLAQSMKKYRPNLRYLENQDHEQER